VRTPRALSLPDAAVVARDLAVPMRDGVRLFADLYRPAAGGPWPVLVQRTPYNKSALLPPIGTLDPFRACAEGFAVLIQDTRGRYRSEGEFYPFRDEAADGYDTVEWVAAQPWCTGRVGLYGRSYAGATCWQAAIARPPHLGALVPIVTASEYCEGWTYRQGALEQSFVLLWALQNLAPERVSRGALALEALAGLADRVTALLASPADPPWDEVARVAPYVRDWLDRAYDDAYWGPWAVWPRVGPDLAPSLSVGGWFDIFARGTVDLFARLQALGPPAAGRHALLMGPWAHVNPIQHFVGEVDFGLRAAPAFCDLGGAILAWFRRWLADDPGAAPRAPVECFLMGTDRWLTADRWPPGDGRVTFHLASEGAARGPAGDGRLAPGPAGRPGADVLTFSRAGPAPSLGGGLCPEYSGNRPGAFDQRPLEARPDVLVYTSPPLARACTVAGSVTAHLFADAEAGEFDLAVKLVDVAPDGAARNVADGIGRSQHLAPPAGRGAGPLALRIDLGPTANVFAAGHRLRVDVALASHPRFDLNPLARDGARTRVHHGPAAPSRIELPVLDR
jgi:putative CocE/NonD family hydrolase